eukprot:6468402-Amphidinium_carterae.1
MIFQYGVNAVVGGAVTDDVFSMDELKRMAAQYSTLQRVADLLCHQRTCELWSMMASMTVPVERHFFASMPALKGKESRLRWVDEKVLGGACHPIHETLCWPSNPEFLHESRLQSCVDHSEQIKRALLRKVWHLCQSFCGQLALSALMWRTPPWSFLGLLAESTEVRARCVSELQREYRALMDIESKAIESKHASEWLHDLHVQEQIFVREVFVWLED